MHTCYMEKIIKDDTQEGMDKLGEAFNNAFEYIKEHDKEMYKKLELKLYEGAYGKVLNEEMAKEIVHNMKPMAKWTLEETNQVHSQFGINNISPLDFFVVMNMMYSDMKNVLGDGATPESIEKYVVATKDWILDEDAKEGKVFCYFNYIVK